MNLLQCYFHLNGGKYGTLACPGVGFFPAFSGNGSATNNPDSAHIPDVGPLPPGRYYILLRERGGTFTQTKDSVNAFFTGSNRNEWFALYRDDEIINDETFFQGVRRGEFRLHPIGPSGLSKGCITLYSQSNFKVLSAALLRTGGIQLGNYKIAHGVVQVY
ncbi:MAG: DUF2778 domain-containing protein [Silvania sp.]|uniref:DUF2778 domain-containing protein n=1 Tax=Silvania sp. TaxID=3016633 RepID=UPI000F93C12B